jgi:predicted transcriptional regulator
MKHTTTKPVTPIEVMNLSNSLLLPSDEMIKKVIYRKRTIAEVLIALSEEPCYVSELSGRLGLARDTISSSIQYLSNAGLVIGVANSKDERLSSIIRAKRKQFEKRLNLRLASNLRKRVEFYFVTEKGKKFLEHARRCLGWT